MTKEISVVYIVYKVNFNENNIDCLEVFSDYAKAKRFVKEHGEGYKIWERPLRSIKKEED